tara:strand:- start:32 stop:2377 length:2346 start_codon:yes stop_codon:yes gene_type:complete
MKNKEVNSINNSNKDILAKLMATENITVIHKRVPTAYFDVKSRTLCCPILKDEMSPQLTDLFMGHEVGHALNTPLEGWHSAVSDKGMMFKGYLNVIEDVRIEKMIKSKYPGLRKSFYSGYKELANKDFFGIRGKDIHSMNFIDRINLYFKIGSVTQITFNDEEQVYIDRCNKLETFEEVMELALELFERQKQITEDELESMTDQQVLDMMEDLGIEDEDGEDGQGESMTVEIEGSEESEEDENEDSSTDGSDAKAEDDEDTSDSDESSSSTDETESSSQEDVESSESSKGGKSPEEKLQDQMNKSETDESFRDKESDLYDDDKYSYREPTYYEIPGKMNYQSYIVDHKKINQIMSTEDHCGHTFDRSKVRHSVKNFEDSNKKIINYMVKEFEMKKAAADYKRSWSSKSGELNMDKLHFYQLKDDIFNRVQVTPEGKSHGVVMLLDWSGSMSGSVKATVEQATLLSMFCRRLSIPFRLYAFSDAYSRIQDIPEELRKRYNRAEYGSDEYYEIEKEIRTFRTSKLFGKPTEDSVELGNVRLLEIYTDKMSKSEFQTAMENWFQLSESIENYYSTYDEEFDHYFGTPSSLHLGGTPLDHSLILIRDYLKDFKSNHNLDIVSLITLTDGSSHGCLRGNNAHLIDRQINKVFKMNNRATHSLLEWVQETVGVRTIGFYISNTKTTQIIWEGQKFCGTEVDPYGEDYEKHRKEFANLSTSFTDGAYDLAILINQKKLKLNYNEDELNVKSIDEGANKGTLKRALVKAGTNKMKQRVILNQFVSQMAV